MEVKQIFSLVNDVTTEVTGQDDLLQEDLINLVDVGNNIIGVDKIDNYVNKLVDRIGRTVFQAKQYTGSVPSVVMDSWEYGSILQKITSEMPEATENETWKLVNGQSYDPNIFYQPSAESKFFDSKVTFEVPVSFAEKQVKESFINAGQMNAFLSMITTNVQNSLAIKTDSLVMRTINNFTGVVINKKNNNTSVNLLALYNTATGSTLTTDKALMDAGFLRYANFIINTYIDRLTRISKLFNVGGRTKFTAKSDQTLVLLSDFAKASDTYLQADVRHNEYTGLQGFSTVPYWQGSGKAYSLDDVSAIKVKVNDGTQEGKIVEQKGIIGVLFDRQALGVANLDKRVTTNYNPKAEFYTNFYKTDAGYFNDFDENYLVFYIADTENP